MNNCIHNHQSGLALANSSKWKSTNYLKFGLWKTKGNLVQVFPLDYCYIPLNSYFSVTFVLKISTRTSQIHSHELGSFHLVNSFTINPFLTMCINVTGHIDGLDSRVKKSANKHCKRSALYKVQIYIHLHVYSTL